MKKIDISFMYTRKIVMLKREWGGGEGLKKTPIFLQIFYFLLYINCR